MGSATEEDRSAKEQTEAAALEDVQTERDDALSADEEKFVAAFVEYWTRRGAQIVRIEP